MTDNQDELDPDYLEIAKMLDDNLTKIHDLNDQLRTHHRGGMVVVTPGITALGAARFAAIMRAVSAFDKFTPDNDPKEEHDCAVINVDGVRVIWKIDYYDRSRRYSSPDASDPSVTCRVMTVMRADEY